MRQMLQQHKQIEKATKKLKKKKIKKQKSEKQIQKLYRRSDNLPNCKRNQTQNNFSSFIEEMVRI